MTLAWLMRNGSALRDRLPGGPEVKCRVVSKVDRVGAAGSHPPHLFVAVAVAHEDDPPAVGRPVGVGLEKRVLCELDGLVGGALGGIGLHHEDLSVAVKVAREGYPVAVWGDGGKLVSALTRGKLGQPGGVHVLVEASSMLSGGLSSVVTRAYMSLLLPPAPNFSAGKPFHHKHDATDVVRAHPPN